MAKQNNSNTDTNTDDLREATWEEMGKNILGTRVDGFLYLKIDMNAEVGMSQNGKSMLIASSSGFQSIPGTTAAEKAWFSGNFGRKP